MHVQLDRHHQLADESKDIEKRKEDTFIAVPLLEDDVPDEVVHCEHHQKSKQHKKAINDDRVSYHI